MIHEKKRTQIMLVKVRTQILDACSICTHVTETKTFRAISESTFVTQNYDF